MVPFTIWGAIDSTVAQAIAQAVYDFDSELILVGLANTLLISEAEKLVYTQLLKFLLIADTRIMVNWSIIVKMMR